MRERPQIVERYLLLYFPWGISSMFSFIPALSFWIAWLGSFYIFYLCYSGKIKSIPNDLPIAEQLMRPIFLVHVIFAGYMSVSPIFNFLEALGIVEINGSQAHNNSSSLQLLALSQRYYCLAHAAYATGLLSQLKNQKNEFNLVIEDLPSFLMRFTAIIILLSTIFRAVPGLTQFYFQLSSLSFISGTMALIYSVRAGRLEYISICSGLFIINFTQALLSGFKEPVIINILVLGIFLYPFYKKIVLALFVPTMIALFLLLPTYNQVFRQKAWANEEDVEVASDAAIAAITAEEDDEKQTTAWSFLTGRLSEVQMFTGYIQSTPSVNDYYGFTILWQSFQVIIPRLFWPNKPITEELVMERVYEASVINRASKVSAKPALVVDGYLSGGASGILITCFAFGFITQFISLTAEKLFGGYLIGTALMFSGLFQILWRGLSFEFLINSVFWSFCTMYFIFLILRLFNVLKKVDKNHTN